MNTQPMKAYATTLAGSSVITPQGNRLVFQRDPHSGAGVYITADPDEIDYLEFLCKRVSSGVRHAEQVQAQLDAAAVPATALAEANLTLDKSEARTNENGELVTSTELTPEQQADAVAAARFALNIPAAGIDDAVGEAVTSPLPESATPAPVVAAKSSLADLAAKIHATGRPVAGK